jgi:hypothetical protein
MNKTLKIIGIAIVVIAASIAIFWTIEKGVERQEKYECYKWQYEAGQYENYYLADWQKLQCYHYNIDINAN